MLIIQGKKITGSLTSLFIETIKAKIKGLPEPKVIPIDEKKLNAEDVVLCLQREVAYIDQYASLESKQYLGSKYFSTCILVYLYTETDHAIIHVDGINCLDLSLIIDKFKTKNDIQVCIAGGYPCEESEKNLTLIIQALYKESQKKEVCITIESQKIIENNLFEEEDKYTQVYDTLLRRAKLLYKKFLNKTLDFNVLTDKKVSDLKNCSATVNKEDLLILATVMSQSALVFDISKKRELEILKTFFLKHFPNEEKILKYLKEMFSIDGFMLTDKGLSNTHQYAKNKLLNFVFDVQSKNIILIPAHLETPYENIRFLPPLDSYTKPSFFIAYNNQKEDYQKPTLSDQFISHCKTIKEALSQPYCDRDAIARFMRINNQTSVFNQLAEYIFSKEATPTTPHLPCRFFTTPKMLSYFYSPQQFSTTNLERLNSLTQDRRLEDKKFEAKLRYFPEYTVDALLACEHEMEAKNLKLKMDYYPFLSMIVHMNNQFYLCIPAINVSSYAEQIKPPTH